MIETITLLPGITLRVCRDTRFKQGCLSFQLVRQMDASEAALNALLPSVLLRGTRQHGEALLPGGSVAFGSMQLLYEAAECAQNLASSPELAEEWAMVSASAKQLMGTLDRDISIS